MLTDKWYIKEVEALLGMSIEELARCVGQSRESLVSEILHARHNESASTCYLGAAHIALKYGMAALKEASKKKPDNSDSTDHNAMAKFIAYQCFRDNSPV